MATASVDVGKECFADSLKFHPDGVDCKICVHKDTCEEEINTRAAEAEAAREEAEADMFSHGRNSTRYIRRAVSHLQPAKKFTPTPPNPPTTSYSQPTTSYTTSYTPASPTSCQGVSPIQAAPRLEGESIWSRLIKNVTLGSLARALTEGVLLAEDERRRPVGSGRDKG
jgi:hypothetical protein